MITTFILGFIAGGILVAAWGHERGAHETEGDIIIEPKRPQTRVMRPWDERSMSPDVPPVDWAKVQKPQGSAVSSRPAANPRLKDRG